MNPDMMNALTQMQKMQEEMERVQATLGSVTATAEAGGGMVKVTANGKNEIVSIKLDKEIVDPNELEMMEDLIITAANRALTNAKELAEEKTNAVAKALMPNIPGLPFNL